MAVEAARRQGPQGVLAILEWLVAGFTNPQLTGLLAGIVDGPDTPRQATYDFLLFAPTGRDPGDIAWPAVDARASAG